MVPFGIVVPNMEAVAADFALGQMLKQQPAGKAARFGIVARGKLDQARNLLRLLEIMLGSLADRRAFERDDALIAFGGGRLVEGDRKETFAEQIGRASCRERVCPYV